MGRNSYKRDSGTKHKGRKGPSQNLWIHYGRNELPNNAHKHTAALSICNNATDWAHFDIEKEVKDDDLYIPKCQRIVEIHHLFETIK